MSQTGKRCTHIDAYARLSAFPPVMQGEHQTAARNLTPRQFAMPEFDGSEVVVADNEAQDCARLRLRGRHSGSSPLTN
jgi:hypothetical protein